MGNIFDEITSTPEDDILLEFVTPDKIQQIKVLKRQVVLPQGDPIGKGCMGFLYSNSLKESISLMNNKAFLSKNKYRFYYYEMNYSGRIGTRTFIKKDFQTRQSIYKELKETQNITGRLKIENKINQNMYIDLMKYLEIFNRTCAKYQPIRYIETFWNFIGNTVIMNTVNSHRSYEEETVNENKVKEKTKRGFNTAFVLVDLSYYPLTGKLMDDLKNPLYLLYYTVFKKPELLKTIDIPFYFFNKDKILVINPSLYVNEDSVTYEKDLKNKLRTEMKKMYLGTATDKDIDNVLDDNKINLDTAKSEVAASIRKLYVPDETVAKADAPVAKAIEKIDKNISDKVDKLAENITTKEITLPTGDKVKAKDLPQSTLSVIINNSVQKDIDKDTELLKQMYYQSNRNAVKRSAASTARDELLRNEQENIEVGDISIEKLKKINASNIKLEEKDISRVLTTSNDDVKTIKYELMSKEYNEKLLKKDITDAILALNDKSIPMFIRDIKVEDTSDELNYKETYTIYLEDANRKRHTIVVDIPKFIDDTFLYIGGNKKIIKNQSFYLPIVKIKPDVVEVVTNYSKMTMTRDNVKSTSYVERLKKLINANDSIRQLFDIGNAYVSNKDFITTIEYDDLSKNFTKFKNGKTTIFFDQNEAIAYMKKNNIEKPNETSMFIGMNNGKPLFLDINNQETDAGTIVDIIVSTLPEQMQLNFDNVKAPKRLVYTKVKIMSQFITVAMLLGFWIGISKLLDALKVSYTFADTNKDVGPDEEYIKFKDCYLIYKQNMSTALIMNGFRQFDTFNYDIREFDDKIPYLNYIKKVYGNQNIENALMNFYEFFIDPITKEILQYTSLPTDIIHVILYASSLLSDSQYKEDIDQSLSRIRRNEVIPAILYEKLARNYINYRNFNGRKKFSIPKDCVIKELLGLKTVEDYSILNPTLEMYQIHSVSSKGFRGVNLDESYTPERRSYDPSMIGVISSSTSPDGSCGVSRNLALEPNIINLRGMIKDVHKDGIDDLKDVNLLSPAEMTMPYAATIDDPNRLGHAVKQSSHVIPVKNSSPVLISNGFEEAARFHLTSNFVINAEEDGTIVDYDEASNIMIAKYKSGKCKAIDLSPTIAKNGGGGFFLSNKLETPFKVGDKFKKDEVLAYHKDFFTNDKYNNCRMNMGTLTKVAIMSTYNTYEDATFITKKMSENCATEMCFKKAAVIGKNSNVFYMVKKGQEISVGDPLIQFDTSFEDDSINALLKNLSADSKQAVLEDSRNEIKSKYSGIIEDIKIYSTVDLPEMNSSLRKIVSDYYKEINHKKEFLEKYDENSKNSILKCGILMNETTHKIAPNNFGVIKGEQVNDDSVLIEFYIKHSEPLEVGSKIA